MSEDEIAIMDGGKCILQLRGVRPFFSEKFDITKHPHYKYLADADKQNTFDVDRFLSTLPRKRQQVVAQDESFDPVSYTHLSTVLRCLLDHLHSRSIPVLRARKQEHLCTKILPEKPLCRHKAHKCTPVSYTHLTKKKAAAHTVQQPSCIVSGCRKGRSDLLLQGLSLIHILFKEFPCKRRFALLGDMLELGDLSREAHEELGRLAA